MDHERTPRPTSQPDEIRPEVSEPVDSEEIDSLLNAADQILDAIDAGDAEQFLRRNQQQGGQ